DPELIGRLVEQMPAATIPGAAIELIRSGTTYSADRDAIVPCYIEGQVVGPAALERPVRIAVAVNGTIRGVTRTYLLDGLRNRLDVIIGESSVPEGDNDV